MQERAEKTQIAIWAVAAVLLALAAYRFLGGGEEAAGRSVPIRVDDPAAAAAAPAREGAAHWVHVAGAVKRPGLYRVPAGSRIGQAVRRAGGRTRRADLTRINLAAKVSDGQQVIVPRIGEAAAAASAPAAPAAGGSRSTISLATATLEQLDSLDGIGPTLARRILEHRDRDGGFKSIEELREVDGIGEKRFEALREALAP